MTMDVPGYEDLAAVLTAAFDQAARGKGKERHANGRAFTDQPIFEINRMLPSKIDGAAYQVIKKTQEACTMAAAGKLEAAKHELLGAIVYAAATYLLIEEKRAQEAVEQGHMYVSADRAWPSPANGGFVGGIDHPIHQSGGVDKMLQPMVKVSMKYLRELEERQRQVSHYRAQRDLHNAGPVEDDGA